MAIRRVDPSMSRPRLHHHHHHHFPTFSHNCRTYQNCAVNERCRRPSTLPGSNVTFLSSRQNAALTTAHARSDEDPHMRDAFRR